jgi:hypothetical protein
MLSSLYESLAPNCLVSKIELFPFCLPFVDISRRLLTTQHQIKTYWPPSWPPLSWLSLPQLVEFNFNVFRFSFSLIMLPWRGHDVYGCYLN